MRSTKLIGFTALIGTTTALALIAPAVSATASGRLAHRITATAAARQVDYGQIAANTVAESVTSAIAAEHLTGFADEEVNRRALG